MKKALLILLAAVLVFAMPACSTPAASTPAASATDQPTDQTAEQAAVQPTDPSVEQDTEPYEITYQSAKVVTIGTSVYAQGIVEVSNISDETLYMEYGHIDVEDGNGNLLSADPTYNYFPEVFAPGEKAYIFLQEEISEDAPGTINLIVSPDIHTADTARSDMTVSDAKLSADSDGWPTILGHVENATGADVNSVRLAAIFFGADGHPFYAIHDYMYDGLANGAKQGFELSAFAPPDDVTVDTISDFVVFAYQEIF